MKSADRTQTANTANTGITVNKEHAAAMRDVFGKHLVEMGKTHPELMVLDADVSGSTRTGWFGDAYPERFYNVGVAEANMVDVAAGLATAGYHPVISTFSIFLALKGTDQIRNVLCYNCLPVIIAGGYGGISDSFDGASHHALTDLAIMRAFPNMTVLSPGDGQEVKDALEEAMKINGPVYIRLSRNETPLLFEGRESLKVGKARKIAEYDEADLSIAVSGIPTYMAVEAQQQLKAEGITAELLEISSIKPIDAEALQASAKKSGKLLTVEEHNIRGGVGSACAEAVSREVPCLIDMIGIEDTFTESGPYDKLMTKYGISVDAIVKRAKKLAEK
ncbi:MAG: 1-deoxy-D-xylulose-5-phosphate synthase [Spirochaetales bacterium]|nr:1-deoxy-D-xylulose-5-phosphate synthase [Spirochaetales bacterium]